MADRSDPGNEPSDAGSSFLDVLVELHETKQTGVLEVRADDVLTIVYLRDGIPVSVEGGVLGQTIGRVMRDQQMLTEEQFRQVIDRMTEALFDDEHVRFGEVAVAMGFLTLDQIHAALTEQVRQRVMHCMQWEDARCRFKPSRDALRGITPFPCSVEPLILDGVKKYFEPDRVDAMLRFIEDHHPRLRGRPDQIGRRFRLQTEEQHLLSSIDGRVTLRELFAESSLDLLHSRQLVVALLLSRCLDLRAEPRPKTPLPKAPKPEVRVGRVRQRIITAQVRRHQRAPASPDRSAPREEQVAPPAAEQPQEAVPAGDDRPSWVVDEAIQSTPPPRGVKRSRLRAERSFVDGRGNLRNGRYRKAAEQLALAHELHPEAIQYELYAAWAELCITEDPDEAQTCRDALQEIVTRALREDRRFAFAHYVRGQLAMARQEYELAASCFARAVKIDPGNGDAKRHYVIARRRIKS
ncbi:MAG: tetratricopeptide repeat protein [Deltaproteobacteria bacterium]|nr:tetratricopeptide repeat protein [Deltaproteobacteria bacterium]MBW2530175.1 tetratricopeptide repeat protein [Deltaproteobacteria bacterium]